jgi:prolyl oligopeptidase
MSGLYSNPEMKNWYTIIPERAVVYSGISVIGGHIVINGTQNASSVLELFTLDGKEAGKIDLPTIGTVSTVGGDMEGDDLFYFFSSISHPPAIFRYEFATKQSEPFAKIEVPFDLSNLELKQVWYNSKDGTPVSMFIVTPKSMPMDGSAPCVLDGYGGFNSMDLPIFNRRKVLWMMHGGVYALANLRGNGEYGEAWHRAGMLENKQNTFDDFVSAAEYLCKEGYTSPSKLSLYGGSNGGLLIGAVVTQRPDICASAVCDVPLLDMIRYQKFKIAKLWVPEYGSSEDSAQFEYLIKYSPYHNVKKGAAYPAVLFKAGDSDSRVDAMHARKMAALMQASTSSGKPIMLRVEGKAGHGQGKPVNKVIEEVVEEWSFVYRALGIRPSR